ncbi:hypothetical protein FLGE108171_05285 [Flavobacterium gelidilacus]|jgi:mannose/cellobiose epimerase-like protein (N-acyl-D-glucosamine 2-epimerase family)|uniref:hypothetical protein n=1 Tax=Flavobacterium gelidilacus TaxID=206041 RepID=UPI0003F5F31C|nr:hypothetical protein [Flavobacterium gelidilacus]
MKNLKLALGLVALATVFTSCKDEKQEMAQKSVDSYEKYVDSISNVAQAEAAANWEAIQTDYEKMKMDAEASLTEAKDKEALQTKVDNSSTKYEEYKVKVVAENEKMNADNSKMMMYKSFFGDSYVSDDMKFNWVNKDNILSVYENFYATVEKNKDSYSREDWDEIKLTYEALDTRKNTVENEGLSSSDNRKIAGIKVKFAPMYTVNRMGSKSEENADAKK